MRILEIRKVQVNRLQGRIELLEDRIAVLEAALWRIDGINDNPAAFNVEIDAVLTGVLRR